MATTGRTYVAGNSNNVRGLEAHDNLYVQQINLR